MKSEQESGSSARRTTEAPTDRVCGISDVGRVRQHNEDGFAILSAASVLAVADGMGGHAAGEVASALALATVAAALSHDSRVSDGGDDSAVQAALIGAMEQAHRAVSAEGRRDPLRLGMGATLILGHVGPDRVLTCHLGDVRGYLWSRGSLRQLTQDHSVIGALVRAGHFTPEEARRHPRRNEISQAIGLPHAIAPGLGRHRLQHGDRLLLCSDGLWESLADDRIAHLLGEPVSVREVAVKLVDEANAAGGEDNVTVVLYQHLAPSEDGWCWEKGAFPLRRRPPADGTRDEDSESAVRDRLWRSVGRGLRHRALAGRGAASCGIRQSACWSSGG